MERIVEIQPGQNQLICRVLDEGQEVGYLVIDSTVDGRAHGGMRIGLDVDESLMSMLARTMTLKYGFAGLPLGGAKAGVIGDPEAPLEDRRRRLLKFGRGIRALLVKRIYVPASDMGTDNEDVRYVLQHLQVPIKARQWGYNLSGYFTGTSVTAAVKAACRQREIELNRCRVAVEGYGKVGSSAARQLERAGASVVAVSTLHGAVYHPQGLDLALIDGLLSQYGSHFVDYYEPSDHLPAHQLLELEVEVLSPCATHHSIHLNNASRVQARIVVPGANNPMTAEAEAILSQQAKLCIPDFVANCGGALGTLMQVAHMKVGDIEQLVDSMLEGKIDRLIQQAGSHPYGLRELAEQTALETIRRHQLGQSGQGMRQKVFQIGLEFNRRGLLPAGLVSRLAVPYFRRLVDRF